MTVAEMIKQTRTNEKMTQEEYGQKFGVSRQTVSSWENGRSLPDLQMLIDICNTYHLSLDKLLNEDTKFVNHIDYRGKIVRLLKWTFIGIFASILLFSCFFIRWKIIASDKNENFANSAVQLGFVLENGIYTLEKNNVQYRLPNQALPFLKDDFYVKHSYADFDLEDVNISVILNEDTYIIQFNHHETLEITTEQEGFKIRRNNLNEKELLLCSKNKEQIRNVLDELMLIYRSVYMRNVA